MASNEVSWAPVVAAPSLGGRWFAGVFRWLGSDAGFCVLLSALAAALALARLALGPWYHLYNPNGVILVQGGPAEWEASYFVTHLPTFLSDYPSQLSISPVHYRTFGNLYLVAMLYAWTGNAYFALGVVDVAYWAAAGVATFFLALRLGAGRWCGALAALLVVSSPALVSNQWMHVLHVAEFASMPIALWAGTVLVDEVRGAWRLGLALGCLLLLASLLYEYQWLLVPVLALLVMIEFRARYLTDLRIRLTSLITIGLSVALLLIATALLKGLFGAVVTTGEFDIYSRAVSQPGSLAIEQLRSLWQHGLLADLGQLPGVAAIRLTAVVYHPAVLITGLAGLALPPSLGLPHRARLVGALLLALAAGAAAAYAAPWTAMSAYPLLYLSVAAACVAAGKGVAQVWRRLTVPVTDDGSQMVARVFALALVLVCVALTNGDLVRDTRFATRWWAEYAVVGAQ